MISAFTVKPERVKVIVKTLLETDIIIFTFVTIGLYAALGMAILGIYDFLFPTTWQNQDFTNVITPLTYIIGFLYYKWLGSLFDGYMSGPTKYAQLCSKVTTFSDKFFSMHSGSSEHKSTNLNEVKKIFIAIIDEGIYLFTKYEGGSAYEAGKRLNKDLKKENDSEVEMILRKNNKDGMTIDGMRDLMILLMQKIKCNEQEGNLKSTDIQLCGKDFDGLYDMLEEIEVSLRVIEPTIFGSLLIGTLFSYFIIWIPYSLWTILSYWASVVVYTIIMFILTNIYLIRTWLGDPFDPTRPIKTVSYGDWKRQSISRIKRNYKNLGLKKMKENKKISFVSLQ